MGRTIIATARPGHKGMAGLTKQAVQSEKQSKIQFRADGTQLRDARIQLDID